MPSHDIIDNHDEKLVDHIKQILPAADSAKFAVGYFFLSGLEAIGSQLSSIKDLRLLIGNTTTRQTIEQISEGCKRLELARDRLDTQVYAKKADRRIMAEDTSVNLKETIEVMDQTDQAEDLVFSLIKMIEEKRLQVKVYTKGRLHAKAYIFDYSNPNPGNEGLAIVGSSNLTLSGLQHNTELNVLVHDKGSPTQQGQGNHARLTSWFKRLWDDEITATLADFQKIAVKQAVQKIRDNGGCFVADVVGLGKSYIGAAITKHFERTEGTRALIICPKSLEEMWVGYNETYKLNAQVLSMGMLIDAPDRGADLFEDLRYKDRDFVLIDESHNFRHNTNKRYSVLQSFLATGRKVCLVTATPRNSSTWDIYSQIKLFHPEDITFLPIDPPNMREYFKLVETGKRTLKDVLSHVLIRRTRKHILQWYGYAADTNVPLRELSEVTRHQYLSGQKRAYVNVGGKHQYFPKRKLKTLRYSIESTYHGLYDYLRKCLGQPRTKRYRPKPGEELTYARYGLWNFVIKSKKHKAPYNELRRAGINLRGLIRTMLFKRFESSVYAFRTTVKRMIKTHELFLKSIERGFVPAGEKADDFLGRHGKFDEVELLDALQAVSGKYSLDDFESEKLIKCIKADLDLLNDMYQQVKRITPDKDDKLQQIIRQLSEPPVSNGKCLIFTQFADTAQYLYENLNPQDEHKDVDFIYGSDKSKSRIVGRFAPKANPEFQFKGTEVEIRWLVATDVLAEGLNMQDCDIVLNYELHWNPVRLIQRFGRIDRIGSEHELIWGLSFLPETELEKTLGIKRILQRRIQEIHDTIGEDSAILDDSERLNPDAMYAIYAPKDNQMSLFPEDDEFVDLNEAEELLRTMASDNPEEFERIVNLRDGIRSSFHNANKGMYVFCEQGNFQQLLLTDSDGKVASRDISRILGVIKADEEIHAPTKLPSKYNHNLMKIKDVFTEEAKHRQSQMEFSTSLTQSQRYILRELRLFFATTDDDNIKAQINLFEKAFRLYPTQAVRKELNLIRRNGLTGQNLLRQLQEIYFRHRMEDRLHDDRQVSKENIPRVICSEALI
ncbi:MAG: helicase [Planctomycetes bacterium]|nr:helicase [Planctomycetota bacterium]